MTRCKLFDIRSNRICTSFFLIMLLGSVGLGVEYPDVAGPGEAEIGFDGDKMILSNNVLEMELSSVEGKFKPIKFVNKHCGAELDGTGGEFFTVTLGDGRKLRCSGLTLSNTAFVDEVTGCVIEMRLELEDGANYVKQILECQQSSHCKNGYQDNWL